MPSSNVCSDRVISMKLSTRLSIAIVLLVLVITCILSVITYRNYTEIAIPRALDRVETHARLNASKLEATLDRVREDINGLRASATMAELIVAKVSSENNRSARDGAAEWERRFAVRFAGELQGKPQYDAIRIIGAADGGRELVRVDRSGSNGMIRTVPRPELKPKGERPYFLNSINLPVEGIYVSCRVDRG
jgi:hypothetical protein